MLPGYLWQMPLNRGDCLQPIHGCCGMRLPHLLWSALPKPFRSSVVFLLTVSLIYQARLPNLEYKYGQLNNLSFDIWNTLQIHLLWENRPILAPLCVLFSPLSPSFTPRLHTTLSLVFLSLSRHARLLLGLIYLARCARAIGKAPGYI